MKATRELLGFACPDRSVCDALARMEASTQWPDGRLNELAGRVRDAASKAEMENLRRDLREKIDGVNANVNGLRNEVRNVVGDPVVENRQKRTAIWVAVIAALTGVAATSLVYLLSGAAPH